MAKSFKPEKLETKDISFPNGSLLTYVFTNSSPVVNWKSE